MTSGLRPCLASQTASSHCLITTLDGAPLDRRTASLVHLALDPGLRRGGGACCADSQPTVAANQV
jgi:hypothetical protein